MDKDISPAVILRSLTKEEYMDYFRKRTFLDKQFTPDAIKKFDDFTTQKSKPKVKKELTDEEKKIRSEKAKMKRDENKDKTKAITRGKTLTNAEKLELTKKTVLDKFINNLVEKEVGKIVEDEEEEDEEVIEKPYEKIKKIQQRVISMNYNEKKEPSTKSSTKSSTNKQFDLPLENDFYDFLNI